MNDNATPLCTWAQFTAGAFADLARKITDVQAQADLLMEATRLCEQEAGRRFVPFTDVTETHPARGIDPARYGRPADPAAVGSTTAVRHCWLTEYAARNPEMWSYSAVSVKVAGPHDTDILGTQIQGPEPDSGHLWFSLGLLVPARSTVYVKVTYSGGYQTIPADLVRAGKFMTAALIVREIAPLPSSSSRDPDVLHANAVTALVDYHRDAGGPL